VEIDNGSINIPFRSKLPSTKEVSKEDLTYSYPYHPQYYNPHVRYISPSNVSPDSPQSTGKKSIVFTYSQVGTSQVKPQPKAKEDIKSPKKPGVESVAESAVSASKSTIPLEKV
jgi:hypothetical protein